MHNSELFNWTFPCIFYKNYLLILYYILVNRDPFIYGGPGATGEEAKNLERGPKSPKPGSNESNAQEDLQVQWGSD